MDDTTDSFIRQQLLLPGTGRVKQFWTLNKDLSNGGATSPETRPQNNSESETSGIDGAGEHENEKGSTV